MIHDVSVHYTAYEQPVVHVGHEPDASWVVIKFLSLPDTHNAKVRLFFPDADTARQVLTEALSKVVPLCMTDAQRIEDEL